MSSPSLHYSEPEQSSLPDTKWYERAGYALLFASCAAVGISLVGWHKLNKSNIFWFCVIMAVVNAVIVCAGPALDYQQNGGR